MSTRPKAPIAILEVDEQVVPDVIAYGHPEVLVFCWTSAATSSTVATRSTRSARKWREASSGKVGEADGVARTPRDPLVTWLAEAARKVIWVDTCPPAETRMLRCARGAGRSSNTTAPGIELSRPLPLRRHQPDYRSKAAR